MCIILVMEDIVARMHSWNIYLKFISHPQVSRESWGYLDEPRKGTWCDGWDDTVLPSFIMQTLVCVCFIQSPDLYRWTCCPACSPSWLVQAEVCCWACNLSWEAERSVPSNSCFVNLHISPPGYTENCLRVVCLVTRPDQNSVGHFTLGRRGSWWPTREYTALRLVFISKKKLETNIPGTGLESLNVSINAV